MTRVEKREELLEKFPYNFWLTGAMKKVFRKVLDIAYQLGIEEGKREAVEEIMLKLGQEGFDGWVEKYKKMFLSNDTTND